ncbi:uncharacterized protein ASPGLDRAFT_1090590 [Aspergillus glaucus CBS 516.65]|uniref:Protein kinase domain-containing protein n=1 Tax=Aspergillus glaucus CBS 516.65 TaxID=1160497 RepID=A0A1L9V512_ASPGL|nr:hypothetical protein ASPGLDRAFT_1090590 [Aspergillus glaucus CBS 516.65]OJJ78986.1 hypothetical protein ASPGLDRAFT_1090590 [Aspergillus glaucus CBS 516.65]
MSPNNVMSTQRSNPSRVQAVREYPKSGAENLIQRFNCFQHANILSSRDCYIDSNHLYAFVDDFPLTLGNLVSAPGIYPTEVEMAAIMSQILDDLCYLGSFGLSHPSLSCREILLGIDGRIKIACLDQCLECSPTESQTKYLRALPAITMELMQKYEKDAGVAGVDDFEPLASWLRYFRLLICSFNEVVSISENALPCCFEISTH